MRLPLSSAFGRTLSLALWISLPASSAGGEISGGVAGYKSDIVPFFKEYCIGCHGPEKNKGKITLHSLDGDLSGGQELEKWEKIMEVLRSGEMPPEDEPQPDGKKKEVITDWIDSGLRGYVAKASAVSTEPTTRRLTNFEYENTMRDLLGFRLKLADNLPKDPVKPYTFNNSAELMRLGPEQIDRYLENARRAMASAIVDPGKPEVHTTRREWTSSGVDRGLGLDEIGVWGNRRHSVAQGMRLRGFPATGEFRIRFKASAILPAGVSEMSLRLLMGYDLGTNSSTLQVEPVGTVKLDISPDNPRVVEFRGRIENFPTKPERPKNGVPQPDTLTVTPQNLYDDGTLNDGRDFSNTRNIAMPRAVVEWIEFEAPLAEVWPPEHHTRILFESNLRSENPKEYVREVLRRFMSRAYRRPATDEDVERFVGVYELIAPEMESFEAAMRETLAMVLVSPQFLMLGGEGEGGGSAQYALASRLSYFLLGSMPDEELLRLAGEGALDDPSVIEGQVQRLLADGRSGDFVRNFTMQWLSLAKMKTVPVNRDLFPRFLYYVARGERAGTEVPYRPTIRDRMIGETVAFVAELIQRNAGVAEIVDSDFAMLDQPLAAHYGVPDVEGDVLRPVQLPQGSRLGGLLTHGSVLIGNGTGSAPHPIYRAVWLREAILGDEVRPPPADVPALTDSVGESAEKATTIKDLLALHRRKESCNDCHARLDPWGIPFEQYNAIGKFQPKVPKEGTRVSPFNAERHRDLTGYAAYLESIATESVDASARVPHGPEVDGMEGLKAYLLKERIDDIAENVLRRLLTYAIGRELNYRDRFAVESMLEKTRKGGYRLQDMILEICQSGLFRKTTNR